MTDQSVDEQIANLQREADDARAKADHATMPDPALAYDLHSGRAACCFLVGDHQTQAFDPQAQALELEALELARAAGDRFTEGRALNWVGLVTGDLARRRTYIEQALALFQSLDDRKNIALTANNLSLLYWSLGLYDRARMYAEQSVRVLRVLHAQITLIQSLESLGRVYIALGDHARARQALDEGLVLTRTTGIRVLEALYGLALGYAMLTQGQFAEARDLLQVTAVQLGEHEARGEQAMALGWLAAAHGALGEREAALDCTAEAVALLEAGHNTEFLPQEIWWWRYQALVTLALNEQPHTDTIDDPWYCLQRAYATVQDQISTLSDAGLRRNYLNKVAINRTIMLAWSRAAVRYGVAIQPDTTAGVTASIQDRLTCMLAISARLNEQRDAQALREFIMDELVELSGAERVYLVLQEPHGAGEQFVTRGIAPEALTTLRSWATPLIDKVAQTRQPVLVQDMLDAAPERDDDLPLLRTHSAVGVPLVVGARLVGMIYADMRAIFGRFEQADVDLLSILATQAITALENARLYAESLRANRELQGVNAAQEQRAAELDAIAEVGRDVSATLDVPMVLECIAHHAMHLLHAGTSAVFLPEPDGQTFRAITVLGLSAAEIQADTITLGEGIIGDLTRRGAAEVVNDTSADPRVRNIPGTPVQAIEQLMVAPLLAGTRPELDGCALAAELRTLRGALPLMLFSSIGRREQVSEAVLVAHLTKPLKPSNLFDALVDLFVGHAVHTPTLPVARPTLDPHMAERLPLRILLAEDNAVNQKLGRRLLGQLGYRADLAANGLEAIAAVARQRYDVLLMDVQMPELDGLEATQQIRRRWPVERPRIIAITANAMQGDRELCLAAGMDDYLTKPIRIDALVDALSKCQ